MAGDTGGGGEGVSGLCPCCARGSRVVPGVAFGNPGLRIGNPFGVFFFEFVLREMAQSLSVVYLHLVFSTKHRQPFLEDAELREEMFRFLSYTSNELGCEIKQVGGMPDHVHILARLSRTITQADWVKELKRTSSIWIKQREPLLADFAWQLGYAVFSVSQSQFQKTYRYILHQQEHHQNLSYQNELRYLLRRHKTTWDERYVWD